jgi:26S proteasome regulatory subunit N1
VDTVG